MKKQSSPFIALLTLALAFMSESLCAQNTTTEIERTTSIAIGTTNHLDTYLSPQEYKGLSVAFLSNVLRSKSNLCDFQFTHEGALDFTSNKADNANALSGHYDFAFAMMHRWNMLGNKLTLRVGGMSDLNIGFAYNMHNTANNPAQAYLSLGIGVAGMATYKLSIGKHTFPITYECRIPLIGVMFSPAFGQSYYEIFNRGDYDHNVVITSFATPSYRHQLSIDIPLSKSKAMRVGYLGDIRQAKPNSLLQHSYSHSFIVGINCIL